MPWRGIFKVFTIGCLGLALTIALVMVRETVSERSMRRAEVYKEMNQTTAGSQVVAGPFLVLPYELQFQEATIDDKGLRRTRMQTTQLQHIVRPRSLQMEARMQTERRYRSLYEILLYSTQLTLKGTFEFNEPDDIARPDGSALRWLPPYLAVLIQDNRGLTTLPLVSLQGKNLEVAPGHGALDLGVDGGFHARIPFDLHQGGSFPFTVDFLIRGMQSFSWLPVGDETRVTMQADWPHPSFQGRALPRAHQISSQGFQAEWESTHFSSNIAQLIRSRPAGTSILDHGIGVQLLQPVDVYQQTERSVKYGFLFIVLTFGAFLLFETLKQLSIHPVQYGLVGLALVLFYVLLLALSEHMAFAASYGIATGALVALLGFYIRYVVHSWRHGLSFAAALALLNGIVYGILLSEDYALLYGACLLFSLLAQTMIITRRVNWSEVKLGR